VPVVLRPAWRSTPNSLYVRWRASTSDEYPTDRNVRWSADDGGTWQALSVGLPEDEAIVPLMLLTSGVALVQVLVSDGFHTATSEPVRVKVPPRPPQVAILQPAQDGAVQTGIPVRLWGIGTASDGRILTDEALSWELDGDPAGTGTEVWVDLPEREGEHRAILRAMDGNEVSEASVTFVATCSGHRPTRLHHE
jgi:hypothetical protein